MNKPELNLSQLGLLLKEDFGVEVSLSIDVRPKGILLTSTDFLIKDLGIFKHTFVNCRFSSFNLIKEKDDKYFIHDLHLTYNYSYGGSDTCSLGKGYVFNCQTKNWYRINKTLNNFKVKQNI
jgi:hypothetical protein